MLPMTIHFSPLDKRPTTSRWSPASLWRPSKRKARLVACGNQASKNGDAEVAAVGLCTVSTRSLVCKGSQKSWGWATVDVKTAFLQAPRREEKGKLTLVTLPAITKEVQICGQEWWLVKGALYGLVESPWGWAVYRDATCKTITWKGEADQLRRINPTPEAHAWPLEELDYCSLLIGSIAGCRSRDSYPSRIGVLHSLSSFLTSSTERVRVTSVSTTGVRTPRMFEVPLHKSLNLVINLLQGLPMS